MAGALLALCTLACAAHGGTERIYELTIEGKRAGYSRYTSERKPNGIETTSETVIKVSLLGAPFDMTYRSVMLHSSDGRRLLSYRLDFTRGKDEARCVCTPEGSKLRIVATRGGATTTRTIPWKPGTHLVEGNDIATWQQMLAAMGAAKPGKVAILAPLAGATQTVGLVRSGPVTVTANGRKRICDKISVGAGVGSVDLLVERKSRDVIELRVPAQKAAFRLSNEAALKGLVTYDPGSRLFSVVNEPLPDPEKLTLLRCRVNIEVAGEKPTPAGLQSPTQKFTGTAKNGRIEGVFQLTPYRYAGKAAPAMASAPPSEPGLVRYLKREPNIESDDPEIKALAKQLTAGCATTWDGVVKIGAWVKQNITYEITGSGARECLRTRKGDCGPHSWLTIALCRAAGIPARITGGVLYSRMLGGSFGQHYWTRVWMGPDGWVPIDTTTGEVGTLSPAHITLWNLAGIAKLDVKVLAYEPRAAQTDTQPVVARKEYRPTRGQSERWVFVSDGKEVATQTAECVTVLDDAGRAFSDWRFEFTMPSASTTIKGTFSLWSDATPRKLAFDVAAGGTAQSGTYAFSRDAVEIALKVGEMPVARKHALKPGEMLQMNNLLTAFSLATRSLVLKPGETRTVPFFAASTMQSLDITFTVAAEARPVTVATGTRPCLVCDVEPIKNRFYLDVETGELVRVEAPKLVIERR